MKTYLSKCYQARDGRYFSMEEAEKSQRKIKARNEEEAFEQLAEIEQEDSELTVQDRWNVFEI